MMRLLRWQVCGSVLVFVSLLLSPRPAWAQAGTATLYGDVKDEQGASLRGATVTLTSADTRATRSSVTNEAGAYRFVALNPGTYSLKVEMGGFRTAVRDKVELTVDTVTKLDIGLKIGSFSEKIEVSAESPILNSADASLGNVITGTQIARLPLEARNPVGLLSLQAGAVYLPTGDQRSGSVSGARSDQSNVTLDGVDVNDPQWGYAYNSVLRVTLESLQELRVSTSNYTADMGRSSAAQVSLITKSGSNRFSGSGYGSHRDTAWSTNEYFLELTQRAAGQKSKAPKLDKNAAGGSLGGPVRRDRMFFFGNYEGLREWSEEPVLRNVPSATLRDGVLQYVCSVASACPGGPVQGLSQTHTIPAGRYGLSPAQIAGLDPLGIGPSRAVSEHFKKYPLPNDPGRDGINYMGYRFSAPIENRYNTYIGRFDYLMDPIGRRKLFFRFTQQDDAVNSVPQFEGQPPNTQRVNKNNGLAVGYDSVLSPNLVNTFRYGLSRIDESTLGLRTANAVTFRFISDFTSLSSTNGRTVSTHNFVEDLSWLKGSHTVKFGANIRFTRAPKYANNNSFHTGNLNPSWVAGSGQNYMPGGSGCGNPLCTQLPAVASSFRAGYGDPWLTILGVISQPSANYNFDKAGNALPNGEPVRRTYATDEYEFYAQDGWRVRPNLTFTGGVRYNVYSPPWEVNGLQVAPSIPLGQWFDMRRQNMLKGIGDNALPPLTLDLAGPANGKKGFYDWDLSNFGPRVSAAWTPHNRGGFLGWLTGNDQMVIRGGYSLLYDRVGFALATIFDEGGSFGMSTSISSTFGTSDETVLAARFKDLATLPPTLPPPPKGGFPSTPPIGNVAIYQSIDDGITTPYHHVFDAVIGRELPGHFAIEAAYVGRRGRNLLIRRDLAMPMDLVDPKSGVSYFEGAKQLITAYRQAGITSSAAANFTGIAPIPYWENMFPGAAGVLSGVLLTATQRMAREYVRRDLDWTTALFNADTACDPACSVLGRYAYWNSQFSQLRAQSSMADADYNSLQVTVRKRWTAGYQFDLNYTLSKSTDLGSAVERDFQGYGGYSGFLLNSWQPRLQYSYSDFDVRHQMNLNWVADLPIGRGHRIGGESGWLNQLIGNWQFAGLFRWTSGFPFNIINSRCCWPTNWNYQGNAELAVPGVYPQTVSPALLNVVGKDANGQNGRPSPFADPAAVLKQIRFALPGEVGFRNMLRGDGYLGADIGIGKSFDLPSNQHLRFRWEIFNVTNTQRFNTADPSMTPDVTSTFGRYNSVLGTCDGRAGRCMQASVKYDF